MNEVEDAIQRFGGAYKLAEALSVTLGREVHPSTVYRWRYPVEKGGTGGYVPTRMRKALRQAARLHGLVWRERT